ncbi:MAG: hypothetical protein H6Q69_224 [Firmicutes bacterium]|nr:hypothetical protein [Bacillota bacterium]
MKKLTIKQAHNIIKSKGLLHTIFVPYNKQFWPNIFRSVTFTTDKGLDNYYSKAKHIGEDGVFYQVSNETTLPYYQVTP